MGEHNSIPNALMMQDFLVWSQIWRLKAWQRVRQRTRLIKPTIFTGLTLSIAGASLSLFPNPVPVLAKQKQQPTTCQDSAQTYLADFRVSGKPLPMVCYQYLAQRDPSAIEVATTSDVDRKKLVDIFGKGVPDKQIFDEIWRPLPGFEKTFFDSKTLSKFYSGGKNMLQIPGISTLGNNPYKVSVIVDCDLYTMVYTGVAKRLTRVYDYNDRYQIKGEFEKDRIEQLCYELGEPPVKIGI